MMNDSVASLLSANKEEKRQGRWNRGYKYNGLLKNVQDLQNSPIGEGPSLDFVFCTCNPTKTHCYLCDETKLLNNLSTKNQLEHDK